MTFHFLSIINQIRKNKLNVDIMDYFYYFILKTDLKITDKKKGREDIKGKINYIKFYLNFKLLLFRGWELLNLISD